MEYFPRVSANVFLESFSALNTGLLFWRQKNSSGGSLLVARARIIFFRRAVPRKKKGIPAMTSVLVGLFVFGIKRPFFLGRSPPVAAPGPSKITRTYARITHRRECGLKTNTQKNVQ